MSMMMWVRGASAAMLLCSLSLDRGMAAGETTKDHRGALIKDVEDMVAHGTMGDASVIVHHCREASRHAEAILQNLAAISQSAEDAIGSLQEVIRQCDRVQNIGARVDPGVSLNPAVKARAAAREAVKHLSAIKGAGLQEPSKRG